METKDPKQQVAELFVDFCPKADLSRMDELEMRQELTGERGIFFLTDDFTLMALVKVPRTISNFRYLKGYNTEVFVRPQ